MLTASHCADPAQIDTFTAHQPATVSAQRIGFEARDTYRFVGDGTQPPSCPWQSAGWDCVCPAGEECTHGDVSLLQLDDSVAFQFGQQAISQTVMNGAVPPGFRFLQQMRRIRTWPVAGSTVYKVGARTGYTAGTVQLTCAFVGAYSFLIGGTLQRTVPRQLCQTLVRGTRSGGGDSGAGVFMYLAGATNQPVPLGILHTGFDCNSDRLCDFWAYTPWARIEEALQTPVLFYYP